MSEVRIDPPPASITCLYCNEDVMGMARVADGTFYDEYGSVRVAHQECALRMVLGGIGHLTNHEFWCNHMKDPDGGLSYRQSAVFADRWIRLKGDDSGS